MLKLTYRHFILLSVSMLFLVMASFSVHASNSHSNREHSKKAGQQDRQELVIKQVRAFATPASGRNSAVFMDIINRTADTITITEANSPVSNKVELHTHKHENNVMKMRPVENFTISGNGRTHSLQPSGDHIMLIDLITRLKAGQQFPLTLKFADRKARAITVHVIKPGGKVTDTQ